MVHFHLPYIPGTLRAEGYRCGIRFELDDRMVCWEKEGAACEVRMDNGNAWSESGFHVQQMPMHNGHMLLILRAGHEKGSITLKIRVEGFEERTVAFTLG